jgi:hypothetical protein
VPCYGLELTASFGFARAHAVEADELVAEGSSWVFRAGDREVYRIPQKLVQAIAEMADRPAAIAWLKNRQRESGQRGLQGAEAPAVRLGQPGHAGRSAVVEGLQLRFEESSASRRRR